MTFRDDLLDDIDEIREIPGELGLRLFTVEVFRRDWSGERPGLGTGYDTVTSVLVGTYNPKVTQVSSRDIIASAGQYQDQDLRIGPITRARWTCRSSTLPSAFSPRRCFQAGRSRLRVGRLLSQDQPTHDASVPLRVRRARGRHPARMTATFDADDFRRKLLDLSASIRNAAHQALAASVHAAHDSAKTSTLFRDGPEQVLRKAWSRRSADSGQALRDREARALRRVGNAAARDPGTTRWRPPLSSSTARRSSVVACSTPAPPSDRSCARLRSVGQQIARLRPRVLHRPAIARFNGS